MSKDLTGPEAAELALDLLAALHTGGERAVIARITEMPSTPFNQAVVIMALANLTAAAIRQGGREVGDVLPDPADDDGTWDPSKSEAVRLVWMAFTADTVASEARDAVWPHGDEDSTARATRLVLLIRAQIGLLNLLLSAMSETHHTHSEES